MGLIVGRRMLTGLGVVAAAPIAGGACKAPYQKFQKKQKKAEPQRDSARRRRNGTSLGRRICKRFVNSRLFCRTASALNRYCRGGSNFGSAVRTEPHNEALPERGDQSAESIILG